MLIYSLKFYDNTVLVRDLFPCYRISDNEIGLYDMMMTMMHHSPAAASPGDSFDLVIVGAVP